jgi:hypothetical protein
MGKDEGMVIGGGELRFDQGYLRCESLAEHPASKEGENRSPLDHQAMLEKLLPNPSTFGRISASIGGRRSNRRKLDSGIRSFWFGPKVALCSMLN